MQRVCFLLKVKTEKLDEYRTAHTDVWPEMLDALRDCGWQNYSLFLNNDGLLVGYFETADLAAAMSGMSKRAINKRWQAKMVPLFEELEGRSPDEGMHFLQSAFYLE